MVLSMVSNAVTRIFGSRNDRLLKSYRKRVAQVSALEGDVRRLSDSQLRQRTAALCDRLAKGERMSAILPEALATAREAMDRAVGLRNMFNPEHKFDAARLSASMQMLYRQTQEQIEQLAPVDVPGGAAPVPGWMQAEIPVELYNAVRELYPTSRPPFRARPFDVQLIGGMVLYEGKIAEMKTGEGKTIVAPLACYLACLEGLACYVVTVNDYLVQRDRDWVFPFYHHLGLTVGAIHPFHMQPPQVKQQAYECNVVYGTNSEFGFDYLRDNMKLSYAEQVQKKRDFCIIDEVDSILIDEARTPLIISGPAHEDAPRYELADQLARHLMNRQREWDAADAKVQACVMRIKGLEGDIRNTADKSTIPAMRDEMHKLAEQLPSLEEARDRYTRFYEVEREKKAAHLTHEGIAEAQKLANVGSFYVGNNMDMPHLLENSLRAHAVYQRDKDYVVRDGEVVIVDEFTGRLMIGRQWSDGLHQAVEAKEKVKIKQETQTLATITIQNYFKLFKRLAGMTGTALTEGQEFSEIYRLEVVVIPTNVPCIRRDLEDVIYVNQNDKWEAILDEIKRMHDVGRPVLVGTTSVENSEMLAGMLAKKHGVKHEVLNAKQHEREAHIVAHAGELGAVMIATNMAGRGTDIRLSPIDRAALVRHWQLRNLLPKQARAEMPDQELLRLSYRHQAHIELGLKPADVEAMSDEQAKLAICRHWARHYTLHDPARVDKMDLSACEAALDEVPCFMHHRLRLFTNIEEMGGLHIVGTERHESRRIDNQLRGRSGRQGDQGSSRFFISLEDDLMKLFANKTVLAALSKLGMKEGVAIEHRWITKSVELAQRKVEERNFEIRKQLLEYDEVANYQRSHFYGMRQEVLEGRRIEQLIFDFIAESVADAVDHYLDRDYVPNQIAAWCNRELEVMIEAFKLRETDLIALQRVVMDNARDDARQIIELTIGEYMSDSTPSEEWDLRGLSSWAMSRFKVDLKHNQLRRMTPAEVREQLTTAALEQLDRKDLSGLARFLDKFYAFRDLAQWAATKFEVELDVEMLAKLEREEVAPHILEQARRAYRQREIEYPVDFMLEMAFAAAPQHGSQWVAEQLIAWANFRYELGWTPQDVLTRPRNELRDALLAEQRKWLAEGKLQEAVDQALAHHRNDTGTLAAWARNRFGQTVELDGLDEHAQREAILEKGRAMLRAELTQLERYVLLSILDAAWKDHLYGMDQLRDAVGLRAFAEQDPRIVYKREGSNLFGQMLRAVRDRVTDLIFRARLTSDTQVKNVYSAQHAEHAEAGSVFAQSAGAGSAEQQEDLAAAQTAGSGEAANLSRRQRRAADSERSEPSDHKRRPQFKDRRRRRR